VETLTSDFEGNPFALETVLESGPDVFNHNVETVRRLSPSVRAKATYDRSLSVLSRAVKFGGAKVKSGLMVGLGETFDELRQTFSDLSALGVELLTVGQYLQPSKEHLPIQKFYSADEFLEIRRIAESFPFENVFCGPLVRSSYHAGEMLKPRICIRREPKDEKTCGKFCSERRKRTRCGTVEELGTKLSQDFLSTATS